GLSSITFADSGTLSLAQLIAQAHSTSATVTNGIDQLQFSAADNESVTGGGSFDTISAWDNNDTLTGGATSQEAIYAAGNNDLIYAGPANYSTIDALGTADTIYGGAGTDKFYIYSADDVVLQPTANGGVDVIISSVSYSLPSNVCQLTLTGTAALVGTAN